MASRTLTVQLRAAVGGYTAGMARAAAATGPLEASLARTQRTGLAMSRVGDKMTRSLTLPLLAVGVAATKMATDFDSELTKMVSLAGVAGDEVDGMRDSVLSLAGETGQAPRELAEGMFMIQSASFSGAAAMEVLDRSARAAATGMGTTGQMADLLTGAMQIYGQENLNATQAADIFTKAVENSKTEVDQVADAITDTIPQADALGVSFMDVAGALAAMATTNSNMNVNATQLKGLFSQLTAITPEFAGRLAAVGVDADRLQAIMAEEGGLVEGMKLLWEATDGNSTAFMGLFPNVQAAQAAMSLAAGEFSVVDAVMDDMQDSVGALDNSFGVWADSMGAQNAQAFAQFQVALIKLGDTLIPIASQVLGFVTTLGNAFDALPSGAQTAIVYFALVAAAAGPLLSVGGRLVRMFGLLGSAATNFAVPAGVLSGRLDASGASMGRVQSQSLGLRHAAMGLVGVIGIATVAWQAYRSSQDKAKEANEAMRAALEATGGELVDQAADLVAVGLETAGLVDQFNAAGIALSDVTDGLGGTDAEFDAFIDSLKEAAVETGNMNLMSTATIALMGDLRGQVINNRDAMGEMGEFTGDAAGELGGLADMTPEARAEMEALGVDVDALGEDFNSLTDAVREYIDALNAAFDPLFGMIDALRGNEDASRALEQAEEDLTAATREHGRGSEEAEEAQRALEKAHQDSAQSALGLQGAALRLRSEIEAGEMSVGEATAALDHWVAQGLITRDTAREMERQFRDAADGAEDLAGDYDVKVNTPGATAAQARIDAIRNSVNAIPNSRDVTITVTEQLRTGGRPAGGHSVFHDGGIVPGARGQEIAAVLLAGEEVLTPEDPRHAANMGTFTPAASTGAGGGGGSSVTVLLSASDRIGRALMAGLRHEVQVQGGGDVQRALGRR